MNENGLFTQIHRNATKYCQLWQDKFVLTKLYKIPIEFGHFTLLKEPKCVKFGANIINFDAEAPKITE